MRDGAVPDELGLALVATLQAAPRADWQRWPAEEADGAEATAVGRLRHGPAAL